MNIWLSWRPDARLAQAARDVLRRGTRVSQHLFSVVGACAIVVALALWLLPTVRGTIAARLMPVIYAAVQAGPARLLSGHPLPAFGPANNGGDADEAQASATPSLDNMKYDGSGSNSLANSGLNSSDARPQSSVDFLAKVMSAQHVAADARDDRVIVPTREQNLVATYLARRYRVAQEPVGELVKTAFDAGRQVGLDPLLLLAVMAIESGFNPYAESGVGAKGLMQVMSSVHSDKFQYFGGTGKALEPFANIQVGALVLKDCIARGGSLSTGLRLYNGSTSPNDSAYGSRVMAVRDSLRDVVRGRAVPGNAPQQVTASAKRVQVALGGTHAPVKSTASTSSAPAQDDTGASTHRGDTAELGA